MTATESFTSVTRKAEKPLIFGAIIIGSHRRRDLPQGNLVVTPALFLGQYPAATDGEIPTGHPANMRQDQSEKLCF